MGSSKRVQLGGLAQTARDDAARSRVLATLPSVPAPLVPAAPADETVGAPVGASLKVSLREIAYNPFNPREELGDVSELRDSLEQIGQATVATLVTKDAFLEVYPNRAADLTIHPDRAATPQEAAAIKYVVIDGNRRRRAVELSGGSQLACVVDDERVRDDVTARVSVLVTSVQHKDFAPLEQARALEDLLATLGTASAVAKVLGRSEGWVSQRRALLKLVPELQERLAANDGVFGVKQARSIGNLPPNEQVAALEDLYRVKTQAGQVVPSPPPVAPPVATTPAPKAPAQRPQQREVADLYPVKAASAGASTGTQADAVPAAAVIRVSSPAEMAKQLHKVLEREAIEELASLLLDSLTS
ncbi:ParB/RepB/Spo0J family partition protein [Embleya sp. NPDC050493]|uniref:ParB/RepB/Spo0J family partition protein n=1 Tax=Embleya sp. NPDC050493 TaxID=3363989 RepID=UPI0037BD1463